MPVSPYLVLCLIVIAMIEGIMFCCVYVWLMILSVGEVVV